MLPKLTLNNLLTFDDTLFNVILLPDDVDGQLLVDTIVRNYGEMQLMIPDWAALRYYTNSWFSSHFQQISRLWKVYTVEYNPIWNKDGTVEETRTPNIQRTVNGTVNATGTDIRTPDLTTERSPDLTTERTPDLSNETTYGGTDTTSDTGTVEQKMQGFNSATYQPSSQEIPNTTTTLVHTGSDTVEQTGTDTVTESGTETVTETGTDQTTRQSAESRSNTETETGEEKIVRRETGNIGVTTTQQMMREDIAINKKYSFYDTVAKMYALDFCVMIY